jgi:hypothetical protein
MSFNLHLNRHKDGHDYPLMRDNTSLADAANVLASDLQFGGIVLEILSHKIVTQTMAFPGVDTHTYLAPATEMRSLLELVYCALFVRSHRAMKPEQNERVMRVVLDLLGGEPPAYFAEYQDRLLGSNGKDWVFVLALGLRTEDDLQFAVNYRGRVNGMADLQALIDWKQEMGVSLSEVAALVGA